MTKYRADLMSVDNKVVSTADINLKNNSHTGIKFPSLKKACVVSHIKLTDKDNNTFTVYFQQTRKLSKTDAIISDVHL